MLPGGTVPGIVCQTSTHGRTHLTRCDALNRTLSVMDGVNEAYILGYNTVAIVPENKVSTSWFGLVVATRYGVTVTVDPLDHNEQRPVIIATMHLSSNGSVSTLKRSASVLADLRFTNRL